MCPSRKFWHKATRRSAHPTLKGDLWLRQTAPPRKTGHIILYSFHFSAWLKMNAEQWQTKNRTALKTETRIIRPPLHAWQNTLWPQMNEIMVYEYLKRIQNKCLVDLERSIRNVPNTLYWPTSGWLIGEDEGDALPSFWIVKASLESFTRTFWSSARLICIEIQPVFRKLWKKNRNHKLRVYSALSVLNNSLWIKNN